MALRMNGLCLILPPAMITNYSPAPYGPFAPLDQTQMITMDHLTTVLRTHKLKGYRLNELSITGSWSLRSVDVCVTTSLHLETGFLDYEFTLNPLRNWGDNGPSLWFEDSDSDADSKVERSNRSFPDNHILMEPIKILAWNARGAASQEFRQTFGELMGKYKPNVVFISETRVGGQRADTIMNSLGMPCAVMVPNSPTSLISFIYASPYIDIRSVLWSNLKSIAASISVPWLVGGDFNDYLTADEKWGGNPACNHRMTFFRNAINECGLSDLGYSGPKFTWWNKRPNGNMIFERLDRFLANSQWLQSFPESIVYHLPRFKSDHNPLLFSTTPHNSSISQRPFRCEKIWLDQPDFANLVHLSWSRDADSSSSLTILQAKALDWNKTSFGNIFHQKNILLKRLHGIHAALTNGPNPFLLNLETELYKALASQLKIIEDFWASKSRIDWLNLGDENSSFFHASVINRRRSNRISSLKNTMGEWITDPNLIQSHIINHFLSIFTPASTTTFPPNLTFPDSSLDLHNFHFIPNDAEIKHALFSLSPYKAPGKDGFQVAFFQKFWSIVKDSVTRDIKFSFQSKTIPPTWNDSLICLIPKCNQPQDIKNFRPISLCSSLYKVISKILVQRIKPSIPSLISFNQGASVPEEKPLTMSS